MKEMVFEQVKSTVSHYTDRAVKSVLDFSNQNDFSLATSSRRVTEFLEFGGDSPVGWSLYYLKQIFGTIKN
jgi:hypothetical protein